AGNTLSMKPSEITPLTSMKVFELMEEAGVPKGVINLVLGPGNPVGSELSKHKDVDLISFPGGIETGKQIMQDATSNMKKISFDDRKSTRLNSSHVSISYAVFRLQK